MKIDIKIDITKKAKTHFVELINNEKDRNGLNLRISVIHPGTENAEVDIVFCPNGSQNKDDLVINCDDFIFYVDLNSMDFLKNATIDFKENKFGGELFITAPFIKGKAPDKYSTLEERIEYVLNSEINPSLADHGGVVRLIEIVENIVVLKFGGGCHGCGMVNVTLQEGIEKKLKQKFPEIIAVRDVTNHTTGVDPYYK